MQNPILLVNGPSVWRTVVYGEDHSRVLRCSVCGWYLKKDSVRTLHEHWFYVGFYCVSCLQETLWSNLRTVAEMNVPFERRVG